MNTICYFPVVEKEEQLIDILSRAAWFFTFCPIDRIFVPIASNKLKHMEWHVAPTMDPSIANKFPILRDRLELVVVKTESNLKSCIEQASIILHWRKDILPNFLSVSTLSSLEKGKKIWQVDPVAVRMEGSFYIEAGLHLIENKLKLIENNKTKFTKLAARLGLFERSYLMATGPSVAQYRKFDYADALTIVCNSVILDEELMDIVRPQILVFADPIFHFGPSKYAASFRAKLLESARKHDFTIFIPFKYYGLFISVIPELADRTIGVPFIKDRDFNFDLKQDFMLKTTANILTFVMIPLATTFSNEIGFLGCDGRPLKENKYFWNHNPRTQFTDKMANIRKIHPGFFNIDYNDYYLEHCQTLEKQLRDAEHIGKKSISLTFSHIPAFQSRLGRGQRLGSSIATEFPIKVVTIDPDGVDWFGHFMAYNDKLSAAFKDQGYSVMVLCNKKLMPDMLAKRPNFYPRLSVNSWSVGRGSSEQFSRKFEEEFLMALREIMTDKSATLLYMYTGSLKHAHIFAKATQLFTNIFVNINLFWLSFQNLKDQDWIEEWRPFFTWLDYANTHFIATLPTRQTQIEIAEIFGVILDVAPHPSTSVYDDQLFSLEESGLSLPSDGFTVLFPGSLRLEKGYKVSVDCVRRLGNKPRIRTVLRYAITASTPKELSLPLDLPDNASLAEGVLTGDEFSELFQKSHIVVLPYSVEAFGKRTSGLLIDALYNGVPVVVIEGTWLAGIVREYDFGVVVNDLAPEQLVQGISFIIANYKTFRRKARIAAEKYFRSNSWKELACFLMKPLKEIKAYPQILDIDFTNLDGISTTGRAKAALPIIGPIERKRQAHWDETHCVAQLFRSILSDMVMVDVGAHHGSALMPFLDQRWKILAFEPDEENRKKLLERLAKHKNASLVNLDIRAVSNESMRSLAFYRSEESTGISSLSTFRSTHRQAQWVDTVTLSDALADKKLSSVDFLKIDTEGHDLFVLQGFPWERFKPTVIECEFEDSKTVPLGYTFHDLAGYLVERGYTIYVSEWHPIIRYGIRHDWNRLVCYPCELANNKAWGNLLAFREPIDEAELVKAARQVLKFGSSKSAAAPKSVNKATTKPKPQLSPTPATNTLPRVINKPIRSSPYIGQNTLAILGNGPSLRGFDFARLDGLATVGMNAAYRYWHQIGWYPTYYMCLDTVVTESHKAQIHELIQSSEDNGILLFLVRQTLVNNYPELQHHPKVVVFDHYLESKYFTGIPLTTGSLAPLFGAMLGYRRVCLLGIDLNYVQQIPEAGSVGGHALEIKNTPRSNPNYFFDDYQRQGDRYNVPDSLPDLHYQSWVAAKRRLDELGVDVVNGNPQSRVDLFDVVDVNVALSAQL